MKRLRRSLVVAGFAALLASSSVAVAQSLTPLEIAQRLGLSDAAIERVKKGEIVAEELKASSDKDLSLVLVATFDTPPKHVYEFVKGERMDEFQTVTLSQGPIDPANPTLSDMNFSAATLKKLANDPGGLFAMSEDEANTVRAAGKQGQEQALAAYRGVLEARAKAYWNQGLAGITPYAGNGRSPKVDLAHANEVAKKLAADPTIRAEIEAVPAKAPGQATHVLSWAVQKGRDQEAPVLIHRILYRRADVDVFVSRRFYSGYDYDALQVAVGVLPIPDDRSVVFYTNHTYTSQVAGFGGGAKRSIGRKLLRSELVAEMERARKVIAAAK